MISQSNIKCWFREEMSVTGTEDCLNLAVFTPVTKPSKLLPVMVFIHGGGFVSGTGDSTFAGPSFLMDQDVVLVSVNYRLGILGFLSLETEEAPGNLGLWDQRMALLWVKKNIKNFGGDPSRVTLFGNSAGSMSINYHLVSPHSRGLFSKAILQSGTVLSPYLNMGRNPGHYAERLASSLGCEDQDKDSVLRCLQSVPVKQLQNKLFMFEEDENIQSDLGLTYPGPWLPITDSFSRSPFLPSTARDLLEEDKWNKVPVMLGFTSEDGLLSTSRLVRDPAYFQRFKENWETYGPLNILGRDVVNITQSDVDFVTGLLADYTNTPVGELRPEDLTDLFTDALFGLSTDRLADLLVRRGHQDVYKYVFSYKGDPLLVYLSVHHIVLPGTSSLSDLITMPPLQALLYVVVRFLRLPSLVPSWRMGTAHGDEIIYLFQLTPVAEMIPSQTDQKVSRQMVELWTEFARSEEPGQGWARAGTGGEAEYFVIDEELGMRTLSEYRERFDRWRH